jgi:hypothetical protein
MPLTCPPPERAVAFLVLDIAIVKALIPDGVPCRHRRGRQFAAPNPLGGYGGRPRPRPCRRALPLCQVHSRRETLQGIMFDDLLRDHGPALWRVIASYAPPGAERDDLAQAVDDAMPVHCHEGPVRSAMRDPPPALPSRIGEASSRHRCRAGTAAGRARLAATSGRVGPADIY